MDPISLKAYKIFVAELQKQRAYIEDLQQRKAHLSSEESEELRIIFHRIKGGGGFFGLQELSKAAGMLEDKVLTGCVNLDTIQELIKVLIAQITAIQPPSP